MFILPETQSQEGDNLHVGKGINEEKKEESNKILKQNMTFDQILQGTFFYHTGKGRKDISVKEKNIDSLVTGSTSVFMSHWFYVRRFLKVLSVCLTTRLISVYSPNMCHLPGTVLGLGHTMSKDSLPHLAF